VHVGSLPPDDVTIGRSGISIGAVMDSVAEKAGSALVLLGSETAQVSMGHGVVSGYLPDDIPQGVTVVTGSTNALSAALTRGFLVPGRPVADVLEGAEDDLIGYGYQPRFGSFLPEVAVVTPTGPSEAERAVWRRATQRGNVVSYETYLSRYPDGYFREEAEAQLAALQRSPEALAAAEEAGLGLSRDARRAIQRNLTILGFDTRGVDGLFGRGTRGAIKGWQSATGLDNTGFLTGNQISRLQIAADVRSAELEEEAKRRQEARDREDSQYWRDTGRGETERGLRQYVENYPDGLFAGIANERLAALNAERQASAERVEREMWASVTEANTTKAYQSYLERYENGVFAPEAKARLGQLEAQEQNRLNAQGGLAEENRVVGNPITRLLVERRLQQLGLDTGKADGKFDQQTRRAIRRYQRARDLPISGFVTQQTLVRLLAGGG
jgi:peptidoglycan hydrolase-like protein with peptidoglycan-binding domain